MIMDIWKELQDEGIDKALLDEIRQFRAEHPATPEAAARILSLIHISDPRD